MKPYLLSPLVGLAVFVPLLLSQSATPPSFEQAVAIYQKSHSFADAETVIRLAAAMSQLPPVPEEARKHFVMGTTLFKDAKTPDDYKQAADEFYEALKLAPWWPEARYNRALADEAYGNFSGAESSLKLYQQFRLPDAEARAVQDKIYALEARAGVVAKKQAAEQAAAAAAQADAQRRADARRLVETFRGAWYGSDCYVGKMSSASLMRGCTLKEMDGKHWRVFDDLSRPGTPHALQFEIETDGTVKLSEYTVWAGCDGDVFGIPEGPPFSPESMRWEVRPKNGPAREIWSSINHDGSWLQISCNRPASGANANPGVGYRYVTWTREP